MPGWVSQATQPVSRAYTVPWLDAEAGVGFVMHQDHGVAASWTVHAAERDGGVLGPVGRPPNAAVAG